MTPEMWTEAYWLLFSAFIVACGVGGGCWYGLRRLGPPEEL